MLEEGQKAPDFCLPGIDENGQEKEYCLKDLLKEGKDLVLYFYPKDNTPGCTTEACDFRDNLNRLTANANVVGVSADSIKRHQGFKEKHSLNFPLLTDEEKGMMRQYGAFGEKKMYGKLLMGIIRSTFIISPDGTIKKKWGKVRTKGHVDKVLEFLGYS